VSPLLYRLMRRLCLDVVIVIDSLVFAAKAQTRRNATVFADSHRWSHWDRSQRRPLHLRFNRLAEQAAVSTLDV